MKYYIIKAYPTFVGATGEWKIKCTEEEIEDIAWEVSVQHIESYEDPAEYEEESGVEYEYDYYYDEITEEEFENLDYELIEL